MWNIGDAVSTSLCALNLKFAFSALGFGGCGSVRMLCNCVICVAGGRGIRMLKFRFCVVFVLRSRPLSGKQKYKWHKHDYNNNNNKHEYAYKDFFKCMRPMRSKRKIILVDTAKSN